MSDDNYYDVLGVEPDANADAIRAAYRDKKAALDASGDKGEVARVNKAWNVLSDPYQRGRYDAVLGDVVDLTNDGVAGDVEVLPPADAPPCRRGLFGPPPGDRPPPPLPTIEPPGGRQFAEQRKRLIAMVIDLFVILTLFIASQVLVTALLNANHEPEIDQLDLLSDEKDCLEQRRDIIEDDDGTLDADCGDVTTSAGVADGGEAVKVGTVTDVDAIESRLDDIDDEAEDIGNDLIPTQQAVTGGFFALGLAYLVVPSALTGQTLGKKIQKIRVVRVDGSKLGWGGAFMRYGLLVFGTYAISLLLGPLAAAIALIVVLGWMRNPNRQGMHDRLAKTIVIDA